MFAAQRKIADSLTKIAFLIIKLNTSLLLQNMSFASEKVQWR